MTSDPLSASTRTGETQCPVGSYCKDGIRKGCGEGKPLPSRWYCPAPGMSEPTAMDPGFYGAGPVGVPANETLTLANECEAGYFCANGRKDPCGAASLYCPAKVSSPIAVQIGYYSTGGANKEKMIQEAQCPVGSYCKGGEKIDCPSGSYGDTTELVQPVCSGLCREGYFCDSGSTSPTQSKCSVRVVAALASSVFCPEGSSTPQDVDDGHYSVPGGGGGTATGQSRCEPGYFCVQGVKQACGDISKYCPAGKNRQRREENPPCM